MAIQKVEYEAASSLQEHSDEVEPLYLLEALYCEEEKWEEDEEEENGNTVINIFSPSPLFILPQDLFWEDLELVSLFTKEHEQQRQLNQETTLIEDVYVSAARKEAVDWILRVNSHYGFTSLTAVLAINYVDRVLCKTLLQKDEPWMIQLVAVTCLSLAAKIEETHVPLLLDLQVEETRYLFEAKTIQSMELLVLSTLQWKMHPITPISFLDHIIRRLGLKNNLHWDFFKRCESLLLRVLSDSRSIRYLPSLLATATMLHVIEQLESFKLIDYQNQLLGVLNFSREKIEDCHNLILELLTNKSKDQNPIHLKRKNRHESRPNSRSCVTDPESYGSSSLKDSWTASYHCCSHACSSSPEPSLKKIKGAQELNRAVVPSPS